MGRFPDILEVRAVEVTTSNVGDAPMLPGLLDQIPSDQSVGSVTADGAYDMAATLTIRPERRTLM